MKSQDQAKGGKANVNPKATVKPMRADQNNMVQEV